MDATYRSRWITPWRWPRWVIWTLAAMFLLTPIIYLLSFPPVAYLLFTLGTRQDDVQITIQRLYLPAIALANQSDVVANFYYWEFQLLTDAFGPVDGLL